MRKILSVITFSLSALSLVSAQKPKPEADKWEAYAGYTFVRNYGDLNDYNTTTSSGDDNVFAPYNMSGAQFAVARYPWAHIGFKAEYAFSRKQSSISDNSWVQETNTDQSFLFGPTVRYRLHGTGPHSVTLFAHELVGVTHVSAGFAVHGGGTARCTDSSDTCTANGMTEVTGGGADVRLTRHVSLRPAELDYWQHDTNLGAFYDESKEGEPNISAHGLRYSAGIALHF